MRFALFLIGSVFAASCAQKEEPVTTYADMPMSERFNSKKPFKDKQGNWTPEVANMRLFDGERKSAYFTGDSNLPSRYQTNDYTKNQWGGGKTYATDAYAGNTDGSRFQTTARDADKASPDAGRAASVPGPYETGAFGTTSAREAGRTIGTGSNAIVDQRRETFPDPDVTTGKEWQEQRKLDIRTTRGMVGRE
ncbi:MAG: hypothetical protein MUF04_12885 [Akkermansiaceae bacterium]|jgi:hypothetical protein|nr:hypothetical protein [Akkermansiaceae bacterium]